MAAKVFNISSNGTTAAQQVDAMTCVILISGSAKGGTLVPQVSHNGAVFGDLTGGSNMLPTAAAVSSVTGFQIPAGWYVRFVLRNAEGTPALTIAVE